MDTAIGLAPLYQGYIDERSTHHVKGWLRNLNDSAQRLNYEVVLKKWGRERVLALGTADRYSDTLLQVGVGDGQYALSVKFAAPLSESERDRVFVRPAGSAHRLELAPALITTPPGFGPYQGFLDECSTRHVAGWVRDLSDPERRVEIEIVIIQADGREEILERCTADALIDDVLVALRDHTANYAFYRIFERELTELSASRCLSESRAERTGSNWPRPCGQDSSRSTISRLISSIIAICAARSAFMIMKA